MKYGALRFNDVANGPGFRVSLFVSGCRRHCPGCFNKDAQDFNYGEEFTDQTISDILTNLARPEIEGLTVLGGEPMEPENQPEVLRLLSKVKEKYPVGKTIWLYSGYELLKELAPGGSKYIKDITPVILTHLDALVEGPFIEALKDITLKFRGSSNQRIIEFRKG